MLRIVILLLFISATGYAQSREEEVLKILNAVRTDPQDFIKTQLTPYLKENNLTNNRYVKSLVSDLKKTKKMNALKMSTALSDVAKLHALDMGRLGKIGHSSSDGTSFADRVRTKAKAGGMIAENCDYGHDSALDIVMALLIDDGIESLGHRKNILESKYQWVGIAIEDHKTYRVNTVMDFAERF
jgi:uncharacterized protein YkwD